MNRTATYGLTHLAIVVKDLNKTKNFYTQVFDMEVMYDTEDFLQLTTPGCNDVLVFEKNEKIKPGASGGIIHFGFRLRDPKQMDGVLKKIKEAGARIKDQGEFVPGSPYVFFEDPDGYEVEVWYEVLPQNA
jgi:catechol 2,3-dioxygenase-like lactoylglutathione lyase family enzyme